MSKIATSIIRFKKTIIGAFLIAAIIGALLSGLVDVNYNMVDYLPPDAQSTKAIDIMKAEFTQAIPNANVMLKNVSITEALAYKEKLAAIDGVEEVFWLDDMIDIKQPLAMADPDTVEQFYQDGHALLSVTIAEGAEKSATGAIQDLIGPDNAVAGEAPDLSTVQQSAVSEVLNATFILVPAIILILTLSTTSWVEPILFLLVIGVSILLNMGTNILKGQISFMTNSVSPILQLAVSLDYAIFLLHSFAANRKKYPDVEEAMHHAIRQSMSTVAASAATTLFGFMALMFMNFRIGADLGLNLAKGIVMSFISVMVFLPALTLKIYPWIDKTQHRDLMPSFHRVIGVITKLAIPIAIIVVLLIAPSYLGQSHTNFIYGNGTNTQSSRTGQDTLAINEEFGKSTVMVLLVPKGDVAREEELCNELNNMDHVTGIVSYASTVDPAIPPNYLDASITDPFYSEKYARIIVYTDTSEEGTTAFKTVEAIQTKAKDYYGDGIWSVGQSTNLLDMKNLVKVDNTRVNLIAILSIFAVLLVTFRSVSLPIILLLTIESGIWINLSIPYFSGTSISFIGYLVISTVQLGATVDYAILLTTHYMRNRQKHHARQAMRQTHLETFHSILVSASILAASGFTLYATSSNPIISGLGLLLGRGTLLSALMVLCFLPAMLILLDKFIHKTTWNADFHTQVEK